MYGADLGHMANTFFNYHLQTGMMVVLVDVVLSEMTQMSKEISRSNWVLVSHLFMFHN